MGERVGRALLRQLDSELLGWSPSWGSGSALSHPLPGAISHPHSPRIMGGEPSREAWVAG